MPLSRLLLLAVLPVPVLVSGCNPLGVKPWQREILARPAMAVTAEPMDAAIDDHIYFSKEAASGGRSFGGGGCGCN
ncbi:MAG TPA: DUF4266 domain-containing protein [Steroidobacteraceae bacterium]|jgi:hypothetical protein|nr:DUF4266 domain-containing protein [Steroidobacteraceae bacterium]